MNTYKINLKFYLEDGQDIAPEMWFRVLGACMDDSVGEETGVRR